MDTPVFLSLIKILMTRLCSPDEKTVEERDKMDNSFGDAIILISSERHVTMAPCEIVA